MRDVIKIKIFLLFFLISLSLCCLGLTSSEIELDIKIDEYGSGVTDIFVSGEIIDDENATIEEKKKELKERFLKSDVKDITEYKEGKRDGFRLRYEFSDLGELVYQIEDFEKAMMTDVFEIIVFSDGNLLKTKEEFNFIGIIDYSGFNKSDENMTEFLYRKVVLNLRLPGQSTSFFGFSSNHETFDANITGNRITWRLLPEAENVYYLTASSEVPLATPWPIQTAISYVITLIIGGASVLLWQRIKKRG